MQAEAQLSKRWTRHLDRRVDSVLRSTPGCAVLRPRGARGFHLGVDQTPNWLLIPIWLNETRGRGRGGKLSGAALSDILWGQYALFVAIRIQDDLLDGQRDDQRLQFVANRFLLSSVESLRHFPELDEEFWAFYRACVRETVDGILEVNWLEKEAGRFRTPHLRLHARVSAIFKVGAAAVCFLRGRRGAVWWLSRLQRALAIASQIRDDMQDLAQDLGAGRFTWVANALLAARPGECIPPDERLRRLGAGILQPQRCAAIAQQLRTNARAAAAAVPKSAPRAIHDLVRKLSAAPAALERSLHEARVRWVFGDAVA